MTEKWTVGIKAAHAVLNPNIIYREDGITAVAFVCGVPMHSTLEEVEINPHYAEALRDARLIAKAPKSCACLLPSKRIQEDKADDGHC